jgi:hypothetical protein
MTPPPAPRPLRDEDAAHLREAARLAHPGDARRIFVDKVRELS